MADNSTSSEQLTPDAYRALYEISRLMIQVQDPASSLKQIVHLARPAFIFDNIVLYELENGERLLPTYARSIGRGRSSEADMAWGESIAQDVFRLDKAIVRREEVGPKQDGKVINRLDLQYFLGIPLHIESELGGALVFIRFGGPPYLPEQIHFASLIAEHIEYLLERQHLVERVATLEADRRLNQLQEHFVSTVSHDLRTPLGFIKGYATTLLREEANWDVATRSEFLNIIVDEADRLTEIVNNLLDSSRLQAGTLPMDFQDVRLATVLGDYMQRIHNSDFDLSFQVDIDSSPQTIEADAARLVQVMDNLIANAAKYAPGSTVTLTLEWQPQKAHIIVSDTGPGISPEHLEDIFKRFYRLQAHRDSVGGTGLGLYICREIVQAHGGIIFAESKPGQGAEFHIWLPCQASLGSLTAPLEEDYA
jgi:signal transduction histidine kinase